MYTTEPMFFVSSVKTMPFSCINLALPAKTSLPFISAFRPLPEISLKLSAWKLSVLKSASAVIDLAMG
jgi:hypothetical protein